MWLAVRGLRSCAARLRVWFRGSLVLHRRSVRCCGLMVRVREAPGTEGRFAQGGEEEQVVLDSGVGVHGHHEIEVERKEECNLQRLELGDLYFTDFGPANRSTVSCKALISSKMVAMKLTSMRC